MQLLQTIWYILWPPYRLRVNAKLGWWTCIRACGHLLFADVVDRYDLEAARILNENAKTFLPNLGSGAVWKESQK
jgi:hypothetical protein